MKKIIFGKTYSTDSAFERGVSVENVEVKKGIKTLVINREYEDMNGNGWFVVTTVSQFRTNNDLGHLTSDDVFLGSAKHLYPLVMDKDGKKTLKRGMERLTTL